MTEQNNINKEETNLSLLATSVIDHEIKAYKRRWVILTIFAIYAAVNSYQWVEYSVINNIVTRYYNVSSVAVDWTSMIYMVLYAPLVIPASYILDKKGLRVAGLIGGLGTAIGTSIKVFSTGPDSFWIVLLGQGISSASQLFIISLPPRLAAVWFKASEISTACSLGVFGTQLGCALGFLIPPIIVKNRENVEDIQQDLKILCWSLTAVVIPSALAVIFYFPLEPPKPPSITQLKERSIQKQFSLKYFFNSLLDLHNNKPFVIHVIAYGINIGVFSAFGTLLNQLVLQYFKNTLDAEEFVGRIGVTMTLVGMIGTISFGILLDKTHKYKEITIFTFFMSSACIVGFMFALEFRSKILIYAACILLGIFSNAYLPAGFEFAMELTYPSSEGTTTGILMAPSQVLGTVFSLGMGKLLVLYGTFWSLATAALFLLLGTIMTYFVPNILKRQEAFKSTTRNVQIQEIKE